MIDTQLEDRKSVVQGKSVDGYSVSYTQSLFDEYLDLLNRDFNLDDTSLERKGRVMFY